MLWTSIKFLKAFPRSAIKGFCWEFKLKWPGVLVSPESKMPTIERLRELEEILPSSTNAGSRTRATTSRPYRGRSSAKGSDLDQPNSFILQTLGDHATSDFITSNVACSRAFRRIQFNRERHDDLIVDSIVIRGWIAGAGAVATAGPISWTAKVIKMRPELTLIWRVSDAALCSREPGEFQVSMGEYG